MPGTSAKVSRAIITRKTEWSHKNELERVEEKEGEEQPELVTSPREREGGDPKRSPMSEETDEVGLDIEWIKSRWPVISEEG